jgi:YesN/AraC family two-component response regulator
MMAGGLKEIFQQSSAASKAKNMAKIKKAPTSCDNGSSGSRDNKPQNTFADEGAFQGLDELRVLLPTDESKLLILEDKFLLRDASLMIKMQKDLFRLYSGEQPHRSSKETRPRKAPPKLTKSIDPEVLKERLLTMIENEEPYLDENITLASLAHAIDIEPHQLTLFLNRYLNSNFHDFINAYRIETAKKLLVNETSENILVVAFRTGFNSKASFNRVFKKITGLTPSQYRKTSTEPPAVSK